MTNIYLFKLIIIFRFILITIVSLSKLLFVLIDNDNIIALATPSGLGAISLIRVSGPESIQIVDKMIAQDENFDPKTGQMNVPEKEGGLAPEKIDRENVRARQAELEIEEKINNC